MVNVKNDDIINITRIWGEIIMKAPKVNWNVRKLVRLVESGSIDFDYPIQRAGGQWDDLQLSLLIHSAASDYPIPPILLLGSKEKKNVDYVLDGKQRFMNIVNYVIGVKNPKTSEYPLNAYKLHPDTPNVFLPDSEDEYEIAGKYFDQLHEDVQSEILGANLSIIRLDEATDEEIEELFFRWNNGTPLTKQQKSRAKMGTQKATLIDKLQKHSFLKEKASFTRLQRRRSDDEAVVLQTMMLMSEDEVESFVADKILQYATGIKEKDITEVVKSVSDALDYADASIESKMSLLKKLHLPTLLVVAKKAYDEDVSNEVFTAWVEDFNYAINSRTRDKALVKTLYKDYMGAGSVKKAKIYGRLNEIIKHFEEFVKLYPLQAGNTPSEKEWNDSDENQIDYEQFMKEANEEGLLGDEQETIVEDVPEEQDQDTVESEEDIVESEKETVESDDVVIDNSEEKDLSEPENADQTQIEKIFADVRE